MFDSVNPNLVSDLEEIAKSIGDSVIRLNTDAPQSYKACWKQTAKATLCHDFIMHDLRVKYKSSKTVIITTMFDNEGIWFPKEKAFIRVKKLNNILLPSNIQTARQEDFKSNGNNFLDKLDVTPTQILIFGYQTDKLMDRVRTIELFPNQGLPSKAWQWRPFEFRNNAQLNMGLKFNPQAVVEPSIRVRTGTDDLLTPGENNNAIWPKFRIRPNDGDSKPQQSERTD